MIGIVLGPRHDVGAIIIARGSSIHAFLRLNCFQTGIVGNGGSLQDIGILPIRMLLLNAFKEIDKDACGLFDMRQAAGVGLPFGFMKAFVNLHDPKGIMPVSPAIATQDFTSAGFATGNSGQHRRWNAELGRGRQK